MSTFPSGSSTALVVASGCRMLPTIFHRGFGSVNSISSTVPVCSPLAFCPEIMNHLCDTVCPTASQIDERPVVLRGDIPVGIFHRPQYVQAPGGSLGEGRRASPDAEPGAAGDAFVAIILFTVVGADLPVVSSRPGLDNLELRVEREGHASVFQSDVPIGLRVIHFRDNYVNPGGREGGIRLGNVLAPLGCSGGIG